ncbi:dTDP-glucose 4,6-dehydratase [Pseudanabaenaceae cyanobacterium LEGE 13415]|nr:dTDP-glucose 4,6-dehydratase [Pseudanabaenaceae cyanobacterium LEGE 13415]
MVRSKRLLVTGGAGFMGTNFVQYWCGKYPDDRVIVLDALTYAGIRSNLAKLKGNFRFVHGNICDRALVDSLLATERIDTIVHFAAESHVDRSISSPAAFVQTNVIGTFTLLEAFRDHSEAARFLHVSTDEVYGSLDADDPAFTEQSPYAPNSPYSASKASSDHFVRAFSKTYDVPTLITHSSNNYGAYQFPEKLIPLMCINMLLGKPLPIYGDGLNVRDWIYVEDHCRALDAVIQRGQIGETYNIGGGNEITNIELVDILCELMNELAPDLPVRPCQKLITYVTDRPGHDRRYAIDITKIKTELNWQPIEQIETGLRKTVLWYLNYSDWWRSLAL